VVGHSLGGYVTAQAATQQAAGVAAIALVDAAGFGPVCNRFLQLLSLPIVGDLLIETGGLGVPTLLRSMVHNPAAITPDVLKLGNLPRPGRRQFLYQLRIGLRCGRTPASSLLRAPGPLGIPSLLLWGAHDPVFPVGTAYEAQRILQTQPPVIFEQSGHWPPREEPGRFNTVLRSFCLENRP
jgi:pimeloyl-ACP methyl ester carboxylesterase